MCVLSYYRKPYASSLPPPLPEFRVTQSTPFAFTGLDYAGPLYLKGTGDKVWVCLFTCCATRALHLDLVVDMTTEAFIRCFKRFVARRGIPRVIVSDNSKTFKSADKVIAEILNHPEIEEFFSGICVKWNFNLEKAPWWGGFFERLVKSTKRCLKKTIGTTKLSYDELHTVLVEVEAILNSRPLTCVSSEDLEEPLTPSHLLTGHAAGGIVVQFVPSTCTRNVRTHPFFIPLCVHTFTTRSCQWTVPLTMAFFVAVVAKPSVLPKFLRRRRYTFSFPCRRDSKASILFITFSSIL